MVEGVDDLGRAVHRAAGASRSSALSCPPPPPHSRRSSGIPIPFLLPSRGGPEARSCRRSVLRLTNESMRIVMVTIIGVLLGFFIGISFPSVSITKLHFPSSFVSYIEDRNSGLTTQALLNHAWTSARNARENSSEPSSNTTLKIYVPTNPKGAERLAPAIVVPETDFHLRRLWGEPSEDLPFKPKYLVTFTVGYAQKENINRAVKKFSDNFAILLFHYDGRVSEWDEFEWSKRAIHISARKQTKWWYAKRFLHPDIVAAYEYIFIWDEDLGVEHFNAEEYIKLVKKYHLEISQPGLEPDRGLTWQMTKRRGDREVHNFVEIMAPVFSRDAWRCVWHMIQNDLVHGWGLDFALRKCVEPAHEKIGVVDSQWIVHQVVPSLGNQGKSENGRPAWEGVRARCRKEWGMFQTRMAEAEKAYYKMMGITPPNSTLIGRVRVRVHPDRRWISPPRRHSLPDKEPMLRTGGGARATAAAQLLSSSSSPPPLRLPRRFLSLTATPYPLYYDLLLYRPSYPNPPKSSAADDRHTRPTDDHLDRAKRRYLRKRRSRLLPDPDATTAKPSSSSSSEFVELKPEVVDFPRLHAREEALYFHDAFALPWEKDKHYRMLYRLEKKYFPDQSLDNAFVPADASPPSSDAADKGLVFFDDDGNNKEAEVKKKKDGEDRGEVLERKVEDFFRSLKKGPGHGEANVMKAKKKEPPQVRHEADEWPQPHLASRRTELPPRWNGPTGTVVLIDKPKGWTSFTVCGKLRRLVNVQKVGHAGTLDPMATGLLIVCVGKATKVVDRYQGMVKGYSGVFRLGEATSTWDADSPVIQREPWEHIKDEDIRKVAASFRGEIWQVPPMFSAIKVGGEKMYDKARRGETVELSPRRISIHQFDIERSLEDRQNLIFRVICSKGTYIRSLCADLGKALGSCAHLTALRRDSIGDFSVNDAWSFAELEEQITKGYL
uniref:tRNA pseudouridine(55) synthase n=2 Tax=Oryza TaxID=4527 RepID=A0A0E0H8F5_ORYNI